MIKIKLKESKYKPEPKRKSVRGIKFYHASPKRFRYGDILTGNRSGGAATGSGNVCMTTTEEPHVTIKSCMKKDDYNTKMNIADPDQWFIYLVEPIGNVVYVEGNHEYQAKSAKVLRNLGKALSLYKKRPNKISIALSPDRERQRMLKLKEEKEPVKLDLNLIVDTIKEYDPSINIVSIYHYGSSFTGEYGKTHKDTYGDIDIGVVVDKPLDEDDWYNSEQYEFLSTENYDVSLTHDDSEIWEPRKLIQGQQLSEQILKERATDSIYSSVYKFLSKYLFNFDYLTEPKFSIQHQMFYDQYGYFPCPVYVASLNPDLFPTSKEEKELYEIYKQMTGDTKFIKDYVQLMFFMSDFTFVFAPKDARPDSGADMSKDGTMRIYIKDWFYNIEDNRQYPDQTILEQMAPGKNEIKQIFNNKTKNMNYIIHHELAHFINALRSGKKDFRSKGGLKQFTPSNKEYSNSTEEMQARISEYDEYLKNIVSLNYSEVGVQEFQILYHLAVKNKTNFIRAFFYSVLFSVYSELGHKRYWDEYTKENKKRMLNRVGDLYEIFKDEHGVIDDIKRRMERGELKFLPVKYPDIDMEGKNAEVHPYTLQPDYSALPQKLQRDFSRNNLKTKLSLKKLGLPKLPQSNPSDNLPDTELVDPPILEESKNIFKWWRQVIKNG